VKCDWVQPASDPIVEGERECDEGPPDAVCRKDREGGGVLEGPNGGIIDDGVEIVEMEGVVKVASPAEPLLRSTLVASDSGCP
jgi:hypothetical protein